MGLLILRHIFSWLPEWIPSVNRALVFLSLQFSIFFFFLSLYCFYVLFLFLGLAWPENHSPIDDSNDCQFGFLFCPFDDLFHMDKENLFSIRGKKTEDLVYLLFICVLMSSNLSAYEFKLIRKMFHAH